MKWAIGLFILDEGALYHTSLLCVKTSPEQLVFQHGHKENDGEIFSPGIPLQTVKPPERASSGLGILLHFFVKIFLEDTVYFEDTFYIKDTFNVEVTFYVEDTY